MSLNRHNPKRDANEPEVIRWYHDRGCSVHPCPNAPFDLVVGYFDNLLGPQTITVEVKSKSGRETARQIEYHCGHKGRHFVVRDEDDVDRSLIPDPPSAILSRGCR